MLPTIEMSKLVFTLTCLLVIQNPKPKSSLDKLITLEMRIRIAPIESSNRDANGLPQNQVL